MERLATMAAEGTELLCSSGTSVYGWSVSAASFVLVC